MTLEEKNSEIAKMKRVWGIYCDPLFHKYLNRIEEFEKDRVYCCHGFDHLINTARIAYIRCLENGCKIEKEIIYTASLLHDLGRAEEYANGTPHDEAGKIIAKKLMGDHGFSAGEIEMVEAAVSSHRKESSTEETEKKDTGLQVLSELLNEADKLSRECFRCHVSDTCKWSEQKKNNNILW